MYNKYISGNTNIVSTYTQDTNMKTLYSMLERLAELFPKQDYGHRLDRYVKLNKPTNPSEVEHLIKNFERKEFKGFYQ